MPIYRLGRALSFPPVEHAEEGLLAVGGDLSVQRLLLAYSCGIFPWYNEGEPILWHSPGERAVITPDTLHVSRRLARTMRSGKFSVTADTCFDHVIYACADTPRDDDDGGTWITTEMARAYIALHKAGFAHSIEVWEGDELAGGLYGVSLGAAFFGESMFSWRTDASKVALVSLVQWGAEHGFHLVDCQMETPHLLSMGAVLMHRETFLEKLRAALLLPTRQGSWTDVFKR